MVEVMLVRYDPCKKEKKRQLYLNYERQDEEKNAENDMV